MSLHVDLFHSFLLHKGTCCMILDTIHLAIAIAISILYLGCMEAS